MIARAHSLGDPSELVAFYRPYLERRLAQQGTADIDGILHEIGTRAARDFAGFQGKTEAALTEWLHGLLRNASGDTARTVAWEEGGDESATVTWHATASEGPGSGAIPVGGVWASRLAEALAKLPRDEREAVQRHFLENRKLTDIAQASGETPEAIVGRLRRGLQRLRAELRMP